MPHDLTPGAFKESMVKKQHFNANKKGGIRSRLSVSDYIVFLIRNVKLLLGNSFYRVIIPLLTGVISINQTLLLTKYLVTLLRTIAEFAI